MANAEYTYDIFIAHSSHKTDIARKLMEDLESRFNIKCCFADRDFAPGKEIAENISDCMADSNKVVLLICEEFIKSAWCWFEQQEAFRKRNCIIPVLLEDVPIPKVLRNITYIKFQNADDLVETIHRAFSRSNETAQHLGERDIEAELEHIGLGTFAECAFSPQFQYCDGLSGAKERIEFMRDETDVRCLQDYFNKAVLYGDLDLTWCILKNDKTYLSSENVYKFCFHARKEVVNSELVETVFQKCKDGPSTTDCKKCYFWACAKDISCLVTYFNKLGCESYIDACFVEKLMSAGRPHLMCGAIRNDEHKNKTLMSMLKNRTWTDKEITSFLDVAIQRQLPEVIQVLITLTGMITFEQFHQMVFFIDEDTCIEVIQKQGYRDQVSLENALDRGILMNMKKLIKEILKQGLVLKPSFLNGRYRSEVMEILIQQYPWTLEDLREIQTNVTEPKSKRLLRNEIEKRIKKNCSNPASSSCSENDANANVET